MLKLDFEKAYDSVSWSFLFDMMRDMGFGALWISWIRECVSSASMSVLINGGPTKEFNVKRGLRQGDPLSPFLYLIVAEGLSRMIKRACDIGYFNPVCVGSNNVAVSHLQFADDSLIMGEGCDTSIRTIKGILRYFELFSGLKINFSKSSLVCFGCDESQAQEWANYLNCQIGSCPFTYLGLPVGGKARDRSTWNKVKEKFEKRLGAWENKFLSLGGRLVPTNSVLNALPIYYLSFFKAPQSILKELMSLQRNFLWGEG